MRACTGWADCLGSGHLPRRGKYVRKEEVVTEEGEALAARIWRQVEHGVDEDLLPTREKRAKDLGY